MPGPAPKPTNLRVLQGNAAHRPLNDAEPQFETVADDYPPPPTLTEEEADKWREIVPMLTSANVLTKADLDDVERYCVNWCRWQEVTADLRDADFLTPTQRGVMKNPLFTVLDSLEVSLQRFSDRFGFNPSYRSKIKTEGGSKKSNKFGK